MSNESNEVSFPIEVRAIRVEQPLGEFFAVSLPASVLLQVTYSNPLRLTDVGKKTGWYRLRGGQRSPDAKRFEAIARYLRGAEAAFPNSIILGANYTKEGSYIGDPDNDQHKTKAWRIVKKANDDLRLRIPSASAVAAIIDGQHRLGAFQETDESLHSMQLLCAVYLDLPVPYQAYLFATINFNQKRVDKSQAYELYGFDVESEPASAWTPDKLAVLLSRRLNVEDGSPFYHRIKIAAENREALGSSADHLVSTATVVEGILSLISQNPKLDRDKMAELSVEDGRSRSMLGTDKSPLRKEFLENQDATIYSVVKAYFLAVREKIWKKATADSYIVKTVGIQALFDVLRAIAAEAVASKAVSVEWFNNRLRPVFNTDFSDQFFQASGKGRVRLKNVLKLQMKLVTLAELPEADQHEYARFEL